MPPPLVTTLPRVAPLSLGYVVVTFPSTSASPSRRASARSLCLRYLLRLNLSSRPSRSVGCRVAPALQPPSRRNSAWCLGLHLLLIPRSWQRSSSFAAAPAAVSVPYDVTFPRAGGPRTSPFRVSSPCASVASAGPPSLLPSPRAPSRASVASARSPPPLPAARARRQGVAPRRERVQVNDVPVPGTLLELGQKASCVSQL